MKSIKQYWFPLLLAAVVAVGLLYGSDQPVQQSLGGGTTNFTGLAVSGDATVGGDLTVTGSVSPGTLAFDDPLTLADLLTLETGLILDTGTVDLNGDADALVIDADADTTISAPTDDPWLPRYSTAPEPTS